MKAAQQLVRFLKEIRCGYVFGIPGGTISPLIDAIIDEPELRLLISRHEAAAAYTAAAYAKYTGNLGVVTSCSGPGATNLLTGVAAAMREQTPLLVLTGQVPISRMGLLAAQEASPWTMDMCRAFEPFTKKSVLVTRPDMLVQSLQFAARIAMQHPQGPVHLALPVDVLSASVEDTPWVSSPNPLRPMVSGPTLVASDELRGFFRRGNGLLYLGAGVRHLSRTQKVVEFAERLGWPVVTSPAGKGIFPEVHPLSAGVFGLAGNERAKVAVQQSERILVLGSGLGELATANWSTDFFNAKELAQVDACADHIGRHRMPTLPIVADLDAFLDQMVQELPSPKAAQIKTPLPPFEEATAVIPRHFVQFAKQIGNEALVYCDIGEHMTWAIRHWRVSVHNGFDISINYGGMGSGIASAIGHALAVPRGITACITGDGCMAMHGSELLTCAQYRIPVVFMVINNSGYGMVHWGQNLLYGRAASELREHHFDIATFASSAGALSYRVESMGDWEKFSIADDLKGHRPIVVEVTVDGSQEIPPMADRVNVLKGGPC